MGDVALLMTGAVLLMNGLVLLDVADGRTVAIINIWGGLLQTISPLILLTQSHTTHQALQVGPPFLFGLTFLWVGVSTLMNASQVGVGWYCAWVVPMTMVFAATSYWTFGDAKLGIVWLNYGFLWGLFWGVLGINRSGWARFTGWSAVFMSFWAVTAVGALSLVDDWSKIPWWTALIATAVSEVAAGVLAVRVPDLAAHLQPPAATSEQAAAEQGAADEPGVAVGVGR